MVTKYSKTLHNLSSVYMSIFLLLVVTQLHVSNAFAQNRTEASYMIAIGESVKLGNTDAKSAWTSDNLEIASVTNDGIVTGLSEGETIVHETVQGRRPFWDFLGLFIPISPSKRHYEIHVAATAENPDTLYLTIGETAKLKPKSLGITRWASSDNEVIQVDMNGQVTGVGEGTATVSATTRSGGHRFWLFWWGQNVATATYQIEVANESEPQTTYTVSFDSNGGSAVEDQIIAKGHKATRPADPTKENSVFAGWYINDTLTDSFDFEGTEIEGDTFLYASWINASDSSDTIISYTEPDPEHIIMGNEEGQYYVNNQVLLTAVDGTPYSQIEELVSAHNGRIVGYISLTDDYQIELSSALSHDELEAMADSLNKNELVELATPHDLSTTVFDAVPNDTEWANTEWDTAYPEGINWGVEAIDAPGAWDYIDKMRYVNVGIIDSMFDTSHEDLTYTKVWNNPNNISSEDLEYDERSHGTHVSGTIAAGYNNNRGIAGVAPLVHLYGYSILGSNTDATVTDSNKSLFGMMEWKYALANLITNDCRVINVSMARPGQSADQLNQEANELGDFLKKLLNKGYDYLLVQAAGNFGREGKDTSYSGIFTNINTEGVRDRIIIVGAIGNNGSHKDGLFGWWGNRIFDNYYYADFSSFGNRVDVVAPGVRIYSTVPDNGYEDGHGFLSSEPWDGTSMAAPHVTGVAAMCYAVNPALTGAQVKTIIVNTAIASGSVTDSNSGHSVRSYPVLDARTAVENALRESGEAVSPINPTTGIVMGNIRGTTANNTPEYLAAVTVTASRINSHNGNLDGYTASTLSDSNGNYELILEAGTYNIDIFKDGYIPCAIAKIVVINDETQYLDNVMLIQDSGESNTATISGYVKNALTGDVVDNVTVNLRLGWNVREGNIAATAKTDTNGAYSTEVRVANYTAELIKDGFITGYVNVLCSPDNTSQDGIITPVLDNNEYRIVLTWGDSPSDLDSHISGPLSDGNRFHVYYSNRSIKDANTNLALLDVDDTTSYGPETITLKKTQDGVYRYSIHNYTNSADSSSDALSMSGAKIEVYRGNELIATYHVPINAIGTVWNVFEIEGDTIRTINTLESISSPSEVSMGSPTNATNSSDPATTSSVTAEDTSK